MKFLPVGSVYSQYTALLMRGVNDKNKSSQMYTYFSKLGKRVFNTFIHSIHMSNEHAFTVLIIKLIRWLRKASYEKNYAIMCFLYYKQEWMAGTKHCPYQSHPGHHDGGCNRRAQCVTSLRHSTHVLKFVITQGFSLKGM